MKKLILASNSPRRKDILLSAGFNFEIITSDYQEISFSVDPIETAKTFAYGKAQSVFNNLKDKSDVVVIGADTVVYFDGEILGKAKNDFDAKKMLKRLSGNTHTVITGYSIISENNCVNNYVESKVTFNKLSQKTIDGYVNCGHYKGKAGSYGIQDGFGLVKEYSGSLTNIIGLPIEEVEPLLKKFLNGEL